jgi:hypothetical protein
VTLTERIERAILCETKLNLSGEYWYTGSGGLLNADEDSDYNHEGHVIEVVITQLCELLGTENIYGPDWVAFKEDVSNGQFSAQLGEDLDEALDELVRMLGREWGDQVAQDAFSAMRESDAREFAIKHWGWIRIAQNNMELPNLLPKTLKIAAEAFQDALTGEYHDVGDEDLIDTTVYVSTYKGVGKQVTISSLMDGRIEAISDLNSDNLKKAGSAMVDKMNRAISPAYYGDSSGG